jgi:hypothetical protein
VRRRRLGMMSSSGSGLDDDDDDDDYRVPLAFCVPHEPHRRPLGLLPPGGPDQNVLVSRRLAVLVLNLLPSHCRSGCRRPFCRSRRGGRRRRQARRNLVVKRSSWVVGRWRRPRESRRCCCCRQRRPRRQHQDPRGRLSDGHAGLSGGGLVGVGLGGSSTSIAIATTLIARPIPS